MRTLVTAAILAITLVAQGQKVNWHRVDLNIRHLDRRLAPAHLMPSQEAAIHKMIMQSIGGDCDAGVFTYSIAPLGRPGIVYASPGQGCLRGGQGSNASLWLIDTAGGRLRIIGKPEGWGLGVQSAVSHGLHDFVTGWHMSAFQTDLSYYRFDGTNYKKISSDSMSTCEDIPGTDSNPGFCLSDGKPVP